MPEVHAILSASSSKRWLNCTPSARLEQNFPNESSVYAEEGTAAHALGEYKLRKYLHERVKRPTSEYEDEEMEANTDIYAEFIISTVERIKETCPHPLVMVEERLDYSYLVPSGFGTGDCVIIADGTLYVMDYKNGKGVFVNCDHADASFHSVCCEGGGVLMIEKLNERITIEKSTVVTDKVGNHRNTWEEYFTCFAYASTYQAQEEEGEVTAEQKSVVFTVRWCSETRNLTSTGYRIRFRDQLYNIESVDPMNYQKKILKIHCRLERRQPDEQNCQH